MLRFPLRYQVYEILKNEHTLTDEEILNALNKNGNSYSINELNKVLMQLEILGLISVRWVSKEKRRVELVERKESDNLNQ